MGSPVKVNENMHTVTKNSEIKDEWKSIGLASSKNFFVKSVVHSQFIICLISNSFGVFYLKKIMPSFFQSLEENKHKSGNKLNVIIIYK